MELIDYLRLLWRRWLWVVALTQLGLVIAVGWCLWAPPVYSASADLFIGVAQSERASAAEAQSASQYTLDRMPSYAALVGSPPVVGVINEQLGTALLADDVVRTVDVSVLDNTVVLQVTARAGDADRAAATANAAALGLGRSIEQLERPSPAAASPVSATVSRPAVPPTAPSSPDVVLTLVLGVVAGVAFGVLAAALRDQAMLRADLQRTAADAARPAGAPASSSATTADDLAAAGTAAEPVAGTASRPPSVPAVAAGARPDPRSSTGWA